MRTAAGAFAGAAASLWLPGCADRVLAPVSSGTETQDYREYISRRIRDVQRRDAGAAREMIGYGKANVVSHFAGKRAAKPAQDMNLEIEVYDAYTQRLLSNVSVNYLGQDYRTGADGVVRIDGGAARPAIRTEPMIIIPGGQITSAGGLALTEPRPLFYSIADNFQQGGRYRYPLIQYFEEDGSDMVTAMISLGRPPDVRKYPVKSYVQPEIVEVTDRSSRPLGTRPSGRFVTDDYVRLVHGGVQVWQDAVDRVAQNIGGPQKRVAEFVDSPDEAGYFYQFADSLRSTDYWEKVDRKTIMYINNVNITGEDHGGTVRHITGHGLFGYGHEIAPGVQVGTMGQSDMPTEMEARITYIGMNQYLPIYDIDENNTLSYSTEPHEELLRLPQDSDNSGSVDFDDFFRFADAFGTSDSTYDFDGDGAVGFDDFFMFADAFGKTKAYQELYQTG